MEFNIGRKNKKIAASITQSVIEANSNKENYSEMMDRFIKNYLQSCEEMGFIEKENVAKFKKTFFDRIQKSHFTEVKITPFDRYVYHGNFLLFSVGSNANDILVEINFYKAITEMLFDCLLDEHIGINNATGNLVAQKIYEHVHNISILPYILEEEIGGFPVRTKREFYQHNFFQILFKQLLLKVGISETFFIKMCFNNGYKKTIQEFLLNNEENTHFCKYLDAIFIGYRTSVLMNKSTEKQYKAVKAYQILLNEKFDSRSINYNVFLQYVTDDKMRENFRILKTMYRN